MEYSDIETEEKPTETEAPSVALKAWNISTFIGMIVPFLVFGYARVTSASNAAELYGQEEEGSRDENNASYNWQAESETPFWLPWKEEIETEARSHLVMTALYLWTLIMVIVVAILVHRHFYQGRLRSVRWYLVGFLTYTILCSALVGGIPQLIEDQGEELFDIAWYGQASVLVLFSCVALAASTLVLTFWICRRIQVRRQELEKEASNDHPYSFF